MSRFNKVSLGTKTTNFAGGEAFMQSKEMELISILLTSFAEDKIYRNSGDTFNRLRTLISEIDNKLFIAKAIVYARTEFGMRSITHVATSELAKYISKEEFARYFYGSVVYRVDDMMEILSYHTSVNGKIPNAMKKGFALAFDKFDKYALAKYRASSKKFSLVDVVNLVHPKPTEKNKEALELLIKGELRSFDTWESELTKAGQSAQNEEEKSEFKKDAWVKLVREKKIGYFALLRNLRNIIEQAPEVIDDALNLLTDEHLIRKSLVLPFRYVTAFNEIAQVSHSSARKVLTALSQAVDISLSNVPKFNGSTLVVLDVSGSMAGKPAEIGSLFSAMLLKSNLDADFMVFSGRASYKTINTLDSTITIATSMKFAMGGTNFRDIFKVANRPYDRVIILSDMQGWIGRENPTAEFNEYKKRYGANPFIYSFDLAGYGTLQFPERNVFCVAGFSEKILPIMQLLEQDSKALIHKVNEVKF